MVQIPVFYTVVVATKKRFDFFARGRGVSELRSKGALYLPCGQELLVMLFSKGNRVLGIATVSTGGTDGTFVDTKVVFVAVLKANVSSRVLSHNHPSGLEECCP